MKQSVLPGAYPPGKLSNRDHAGEAHEQNKRLRILRNKKGQATVEYLIVGLALIATISALGVLGGRLSEGLFVEHAADSASHALTKHTAGSAGDVLLY